MATEPPPRRTCAGVRRGGTGDAEAWTPLPEWVNDRDAVNLLLARRSGGDTDTWRVWHGLLTLARVLDTLALHPDAELTYVPGAWQVVAALAGRLPAAPAGRIVPPDLLDPEADTDALTRELSGAAHALIAALAAPADADSDATAADASATVASLVPLLERWHREVPVIARLLRVVREVEADRRSLPR